MRSIALLVIIVPFAAGAALAQSAAGNIAGSVRDPNGAGVTGATVEVTNNSTGEKRTVTTNDEGGYTVANLPLGTYTVTATSSGFAPATARSVSVSVSYTTPADLTLAPAGASESIVVVGTDTQTTVNTTDQQLSTLIDNKKILDLPLLSRDPNSLILLAPGTTTSDSRLGGFVVNGQRERSNNFMVDGIDNNDTEVPGGRGGAATPNIDATQEFRVITSNFNAEFGRNTGAIINVVTRGGTNEFHGNAYIYYRSDAFSARDFFDVSGEADPLQRRQFGGSVGGPIKKDRAFFFFNYERDNFDVGQQVFRVVPSARARQGFLDTGPDLFGTLDIRPDGANNASGETLDAALETFFGIPPQGTPDFGLNPAITALLNRIYPLGNSPGESPLPGVFDAFRFSDVASQQSHQITTRADYRLTERHSLAGSFNFNQGDFSVLEQSFPGFNDGGIAPFRSFGLSLNLTSVLSPNHINELRFGGNRIEVNFNLPGTGGAPTGAYGEVLSAFTNNGVPRAGQSFGGENGSLIDLTGIGGITNLNTIGIDSQFRYTGTTNLADSFTWVKGNHNFKFGGETRFVYENGAYNFFRKEFLNFSLAQFGFGVLTDNEGNSIPTTGIGGALNDYATFLYGLVFNQQQTQFYDKDANRVDQDYRGFRVRELDLFFQDQWKVRPNLTLNYGLRWEYKGVPYEVNGQLSNLVGQDPAGPAPAGGFVFQTVGRNSDNPSVPLYEEDYNNFAPRVGFAYSPDFRSGFISRLTGGPGRTSVRGGYGVFYDRIFGNLYRNSSSNPPFMNTYIDFPFATIQDFNRPTTLGPITEVENGAELAVNLFPNGGNNIFKQGWATPYTQSWNFGFQRQFGETFLFEADYLGSKATSLIRALDAQATSVLRANAILGRDRAINPTNTRANYLNGVLNTAFGQGSAIINVPAGFSTYNALALRATKRLARTFLGEGQFQAAYTWAHSIDNAPDPLDSGRGGRVVPRDSSGFGGGLGAERGNSDFDTRHRFVANFIYDLPFRSANSLVDHLIGDWTVSGIVTLQSGTPFSIFSSRDSIGAGLSQRASYAEPGQGLPPTAAETERARTQVGPSRSLFRQPNVGEPGNVQRNSFYGDGYQNTDISVIKRFPITETVRLRLQADIFNLFNNVNLLNPSNLLSQNSVGSTTFGQSTEATPARRMQFAARIEF